MIFCKSKKSAERTLENILPYIEEKLFLKVNRKKTKVDHISKVKYLGYTYYRYKGKCRFRVHSKSVTKMKDKIRQLTDRNNGMSNKVREEKYQQYVRGWVEYFKLADMKNLLKTTDEWARRRIRAVYWKQWKKIKTRYRMLKAPGLEHWKAKELACSRKGYWRMAQVLNQIFSNKIIASWDIHPYSTIIQEFVKTKELPCTERYAPWCGRTVNKIIIYLLPDFQQSFPAGELLKRTACMEAGIERRRCLLEDIKTFFSGFAKVIHIQKVFFTHGTDFGRSGVWTLSFHISHSEKPGNA